MTDLGTLGIIWWSLDGGLWMGSKWEGARLMWFSQGSSDYQFFGVWDENLTQMLHGTFGRKTYLNESCIVLGLVAYWPLTESPQWYPHLYLSPLPAWIFRKKNILAIGVGFKAFFFESHLWFSGRGEFSKRFFDIFLAQAWRWNVLVVKIVFSKWKR